MYFVRRWADFEPLWIASAGPDSSDWRKLVRSEVYSKVVDGVVEGQKKRAYPY